jgi:hypothetical protein
MMMRMGMVVRTGRLVHPSTAGFARVATAHLPEHHTAPEIPGQLRQLLGERHWLIEIGQEIAECAPLGHCIPAFGTTPSPHSERPVIEYNSTIRHNQRNVLNVSNRIIRSATQDRIIPVDEAFAGNERFSARVM